MDTHKFTTKEPGWGFKTFTTIGRLIDELDAETGLVRGVFLPM